MKKWIIALLCLCLLLSLAACEKAEETPAPSLQVGFGRADITPDFKMPLQGYPGPQNRIYARILDPIYATCIAFSDGESTVLLYTLDLTGSCWDAVALAKTDIQNELGVPFKSIMVSCTHNHSSPSLVDSPNRERYVQLLRDQMLQAAKDAIADLKTANLYSGSVEAEGLNAVRHYMLSDGSVCGDNFGDTEGKSYTGHVGKPDQQLQILRFAREDGKDIVLSNWQAHPHRTGGEMVLDLSSDIVGPMRSFVEETMDCHFAYFTGASGNLNSTSRIGSENAAMDYVSHGIQLGQYACLAMTDMTPVATGKVQITEVNYAPINKVSGKEGSEVEMHGISIGDAAFAIVPYEMFSQSGEYIKENSPFKTTFVVTCANYDGGYMPVEANYDYNGEESYEGSKCEYVKGTAEILADQYVQLLNTLHSTRGAGITPATANATLYRNVGKGSARTANADGTYSADFVTGGELVTLTVADEATMTAIDKLSWVGLTVTDGKITAYYPLSEMPQSLLCIDYCVQSMASSTVKVNANEQLLGKEVVLKLKDVPIYNVSAVATVPGEEAQLQKGDLVSAVLDEKGELLCVYITGREGVYAPVMRHCDHCKKEVEFLNWFRTNALPTASGHYYLEGDVTLSGTQVIGNHDITLDLNGCTIKQVTEGEGIYLMRDGSVLTIMDSAGTGKLIPCSTANDLYYTVWKGLCVRMDSNAKELNIYGGTFDGSAATAQHCTTVDNMMGTMNIYGGTFIGGQTYGAGGATIMAQDRTNIYGGTFIGGISHNTDYATDAIKGGGNVYVAGSSTVHIYGGTFEGGEAEMLGGNFLVYGKLYLHGGTITGGTAGEAGNTLYCEQRGSLFFEGSVTIQGEVLVEEGATLETGSEFTGKVTRKANGALTIK